VPLKLLIDNSGVALPTNFVSVWAGTARAANINVAAIFAVTAGGAVYGWGENGNGQVGLGDSAPRSNILRPTLVAGATNVSRIYVSSRSVTALRKDGTVLVWGETELSGIGTTSTPTAVTGLRPITGLTRNAFNPYGQERYFITAP
jgi:alpha-tubulin suppressor-like RCC1 family protein